MISALNAIPDINKEVEKKQILQILEKNYSTLGPMWVTQQMEWCNGIYSCFKNHDKFLIIVYLLQKTLNFYSRNFIKLTYDEFYKQNIVEIAKFNIHEISDGLNIPKESARRKITELEDMGVIKRIKKKIIIDRSSFVFVKPENTIRRISRFLTTVASICENEKIIEKKLSSEDIELVIKKNFSYIWKIYYEMQLPMMIRYKNIFKDLETFHIFGTCVVNQHLHLQKMSEHTMSRHDFINSIVTKDTQGINAMSISDITGIPRATVIRKLKILIIKKNLQIDQKKHYRLTGEFIEKFKLPQQNVLENLADFSTKIFNFAVQ